MQDADRVIGRLEEFKEWSKKEFDYIRKELHVLNRFKWTVYGGSTVISIIVALIFHVLKG